MFGKQFLREPPPGRDWLRHKSTWRWIPVLSYSSTWDTSWSGPPHYRTWELSCRSPWRSTLVTASGHSIYFKMFTRSPCPDSLWGGSRSRCSWRWWMWWSYSSQCLHTSPGTPLWQDRDTLYNSTELSTLLWCLTAWWWRTFLTACTRMLALDSCLSCWQTPHFLPHNKSTKQKTNKSDSVSLEACELTRSTAIHRNLNKS